MMQTITVTINGEQQSFHVDSINSISKAAFACNGGGVGIYGRSNFVHMDCGPVRSWKG
jgi:uncharacterized protein YcbK (DUF882 family)